jgi:hypothetical protein
MNKQARVAQKLDKKDVENDVLQKQEMRRI